MVNVSINLKKFHEVQPGLAHINIPMWYLIPTMYEVDNTCGTEFSYFINFSTEDIHLTMGENVKILSRK